MTPSHEPLSPPSSAGRRGTLRRNEKSLLLRSLRGLAAVRPRKMPTKRRPARDSPMGTTSGPCWCVSR